MVNMRCNICDRLLSQPRYNREIKTWEPCETCTEVINDTINSFKDNAVFTDEDLSEAGIPITSNFLLDNNSET